MRSFIAGPSAAASKAGSLAQVWRERGAAGRGGTRRDEAGQNGHWQPLQRDDTV
jgi:hypothetical protein